MKAWIQTPEGYIVDVTHLEVARRRAQWRACIYGWVALGLAIGLVYAGLTRHSDCAAPVMQLEPETIRGSANPGVWL